MKNILVQEGEEMTKTDKFLKEFYTETFGFNDATRKFEKGFTFLGYSLLANVQLKVNKDSNSLEDTIQLQELVSNNVGKGEASFVLDWFLRLADKHGVRVVGEAIPRYQWKGKGGNFTRRPKDFAKRELVFWYVKHGFKRTGKRSEIIYEKKRK